MSKIELQIKTKQSKTNYKILHKICSKNISSNCLFNINNIIVNSTSIKLYNDKIKK